MKSYRLFVTLLAALGLLLSSGAVMAQTAGDSGKAEASGKAKKKKAKKAVIKTPCKVARHIAKKTGDKKFLVKMADWRKALKASGGEPSVKQRIKARKACRKYVRAHRKAKKGDEATPSDDEAGAEDSEEAAALDEGDSGDE